MNNIRLIPAYSSIVLLLLGIIGGLPSDFYFILRWVICGSGIYYGLTLNKIKSNNITSPLLFFISIVFNPIIPFYLGRELWLLVDAFTFIIFTYMLRSIKNETLK